MPRKQLSSGQVLLIVGAMGFVSVSGFLQVSPVSSLAVIKQQTGLLTADIAYASATFLVLYALMQVPNGVLLDRFGINVLLPAGILLTMLGVVIHWHSKGVTTLAMGRGVLGLGCSIAYLGLLSIFLRFFHPALFPVLIGLGEAASTGGTLFSVSSLTTVFQVLGWHAEHIMILVLLGIVFVAVLFGLYSLKGHAGLGGVAGVTFKQLCQRIRELVGNRPFLAVLVYCFFIWMQIMAFAGYWAREYFVVMHGYASSTAVELVELTWVGFLVGALLAGAVSNRLRHPKHIVVALSVLGVLTAGTFAIPILMSFSLLVCLQILTGISAAGVIVSFAFIRELIQPAVQATAMGMASTAAWLGGFCGQVVFGSIVEYSHPSQLLPFGDDSHYYAAVLMLPACALVAMLVIVLGTRGASKQPEASRTHSV